MSKKEYKQYLKEFKKRSAKIPWRIYKKIIEKEYGAIEGKRSHTAGSKRSFMIGDKIVFVIHEPHRKDDYVGKYDHHNILDLLRLNGLMENEEEKE
jgi:hypothetical protein